MNLVDHDINNLHRIIEAFVALGKDERAAHYADIAVELMQERRAFVRDAAYFGVAPAATDSDLGEVVFSIEDEDDDDDKDDFDFGDNEDEDEDNSEDNSEDDGPDLTVTVGSETEGWGGEEPTALDTPDAQAALDEAANPQALGLTDVANPTANYVEAIDPRFSRSPWWTRAGGN